MKTEKAFCTVCNKESAVEVLDGEVETTQPFQQMVGGQTFTMRAILTHRCVVCDTKGSVLWFEDGPTLVDPSSKVKEIIDHN